MLALIDYKYISFYPFRRAPRPRYDTVFGMRVIRLTAGISRRSGRCSKSIKALAKTEADMACFSEDFPAREQFKIREPACEIAYEHLLPAIIAQHNFEGDTALLVAGADPGSAGILSQLVRRFRYVLTLGVPRGELERLKRTVGASVISEPSRERIAEAELAVFMRCAKETKLSENCVALSAKTLYLENVKYSKFVSQPEFDTPGESPEGFERRALLSEALRRGALPWSRVIVGISQILTK